MACPFNSFRYNTTLCACNPGYLYNATANSCALFSGEEVKAESLVDYPLNFPATIFSFDSIKKFTQSQAVFLEATFTVLLSWLAFCLLMRLGKLGDGRSIWFRIRWWISRLDICFATRHWLDDQKVVMKRKTELGGTFSIASWILFIGLFAALLYQIISKRTIEVHNLRAVNAPDLSSFRNDMEFNITTISSMTCSHLRGLGTLVVGNPGFIDHRVTPLSTFVNFSCLNSTKGPTISFKCENCQIIRDNAYISWKFVDLPNDPVTAVGFQFNITVKQANKKHLSFVSGTLKNGSNLDDRPITFRGADPNILKFNLFPRIYHNLHDLKLIQPLFHEFLPGSSFSEVLQLQESLESSNEGLVNTTLYINFLSAYVVEVDNQNILGPVSFLADLGGLYCISIGIFFYLLVQCEHKIKRLRYEDSIMLRIRNRRKAQENWDKLRKYVMYTWGPSTLDCGNDEVREKVCCAGVITDSSRRNRSLRKRRLEDKMDRINFNQKVNLPSEEKATPACINVHEANSCLSKSTPSNLGARFLTSTSEMVPESETSGTLSNGKCKRVGSLPEGDAPLSHAFSGDDDNSFPPPPLLEFKAGTEITLSDIQKNLQNMYEYNVVLREKLVAAQSTIDYLTTKASSSVVESKT